MADFFVAVAEGDVRRVASFLDSGVNVNASNTLGKSALHICAARGHVECCAILLNHDACLYTFDVQGNTAFHIAALENHIDILKLLYNHARMKIQKLYLNDLFAEHQEEISFIAISEIIFERVQALKLTPYDTPRYEKQWLVDGYIELQSTLDAKYLHLIPPVNPEVIDYVLRTFDPRPETGVYTSNPLYNPLQPDDVLVFHPTIPSPVELAFLLMQCLRMCALDVSNRLWRRTPLHVACDMNVTDSHQGIILFLLNNCGCNCTLRDKNRKTPMELLVQDKPNLPNAPTASRLAEELITSRRDEFFDAAEAEAAKTLTRDQEARRAALLESCGALAYLDSPLLWDARRNAAAQLFAYPTCAKFVDLETKSLFYGHVVDSPVEGSYFDSFSWELEPSPLAHEVHRVDSLLLLCSLRSRLLRGAGDWDMLRSFEIDVDMYLHRPSFTLQFDAPPALSWSALLRDASTTGRLGFYQEWVSMTDIHGNAFYFNYLKNEASWERPADAGDTPMKEQLCYGSYVRNFLLPSLMIIVYLRRTSTSRARYSPVTSVSFD